MKITIFEIKNLSDEINSQSDTIKWIELEDSIIYIAQIEAQGSPA